MMTPIIPIFLFFDSYYSYFSIFCTLYTPYIYTHMLLSRFCTLLCALVTVDTAYTIYFFLIHHCTNSLSSLHIFVHHCTFCASLHTKTSPASAPLDPFLPGATRVTSMRVLGVVLSANLTMGNHLDEILSSSASSIHALSMLMSHGLGSPQLHVIARSTTLASMLYASPAWWGFTSARDKDRLEKLIGWLQRGGFLPDVGLSFADLTSPSY